jgi:hypothetical protein
MTIYLLSCVGIGVNRFYCCGKLASVTLTYAMPDNSAKDSGVKDNCCKHEKQSFKVKDSHVTSASFIFNDVLPMLLPAQHHWVTVAVTAKDAAHTNYQTNPPPDNPSVPIYALNCTYRI